MFSGSRGRDALAATVATLRGDWGVDVYIEPGAGLVSDVGVLVATVVDLFDSGGAAVAVLDTTVNHYPNAFSYQYSPRVAGTVPHARHRYVLAGASCLAGDVFGSYGFREALRVGSRVVFPRAGAYTLAKANMFNGIPLPAVYDLRPDGSLVCHGAPGYEAFMTVCARHGAGVHEDGAADEPPLASAANSSHFPVSS
jgi:carboxynorspermidine decarboxylase